MKEEKNYLYLIDIGIFGDKKQGLVQGYFYRVLSEDYTKLIFHYNTTVRIY